MESSEHDADSQVIPVRESEYTAGPAARHRSASSTRRHLFFALASIWGFIAGVGGLLAAMSAAGRPLHPGLGVTAGLIPAFIVAVAGGFIAAAAYRESKRRSR